MVEEAADSWFRHRAFPRSTWHLVREDERGEGLMTLWFMLIGQIHLLSLFLQLRRRFKQGVPLTRHLEILTSKNLLVFERNEDVSAYITVVICNEPHSTYYTPPK
jgi:hypothetical protein